MIPVIESIACLISIFFAYRFPLGIPLQLLFLNMHFGNTYIGSLNLTIYVFLIPSLILTIWKRLKFFKNIDFNPELKKYSIQVGLFFIMISITHLAIWKQFPKNTITLLIKSLWVAPLCLLPCHKEDIMRLSKIGFYLLVISTLLYFPQAIEFYYQYGGKSLGRVVAGGMTFEELKINQLSFIPTQFGEGKIKNGIFALIENYSFSYTILASFFTSYFFHIYLAKTLICLFLYTLIFAFLYTQQYFTATASFIIFNLIVIYKLLTNKNSPVEQSFRIKIISLVSIVFLSVLTIFYSKAYQQRIENNFSSTSSEKNKVKGRSRLTIIYDSASHALFKSPLLGEGDRLPNKYVKYSNHSFSIDFMISFGLPAFFVFIYLFYMNSINEILFLPAKESYYQVFYLTTLIAAFFVSTICIFGSQPGAFGFLIFLSCIRLGTKNQYN